MAIATTTLLAGALFLNAGMTAMGALNKPSTPEMPEDPSIKANKAKQRKAGEMGAATKAQAAAAGSGTSQRGGTLLTGPGGVTGGTSGTQRKTLLGY